jgi:hypothetical protein
VPKSKTSQRLQTLPKARLIEYDIYRHFIRTIADIQELFERKSPICLVALGSFLDYHLPTKKEHT